MKVISKYSLLYQLPWLYWQICFVFLAINVFSYNIFTAQKRLISNNIYVSLKVYILHLKMIWYEHFLEIIFFQETLYQWLWNLDGSLSGLKLRLLEKDYSRNISQNMNIEYLEHVNNKSRLVFHHELKTTSLRYESLVLIQNKKCNAKILISATITSHS